MARGQLPDFYKGGLHARSEGLNIEAQRVEAGAEF